MAVRKLRDYSKIYFTASSALLALYVHSSAHALMAPLSKEEKLELKSLQSSLEMTISKNSASHLKLAILYCRDQELEKALKAFLKAIDTIETTKSYTYTSAEKDYYQKAFKIYLDAQGKDVIAASEHIVKNFSPLIDEHPDYCKLGLLVAAAYANLKEFSCHFKLFYSCYEKLPDDYLAQKTLAILHIKLLEKMIPGEDKDFVQAKVFKHLNAAAKSQAGDYSLYKLLLLYTLGEDRPIITSQVLKTLMAENISIPRAELSFFIQQGFEFCPLNLVAQFVAQAKCHYPNSRLLEAAEQEILSKQKGTACQNPAL